MIDDDDVGISAAMMPTGGWLAFALGAAVILLLAYLAIENAEQCQERACEYGSAHLLDGECVCVGRAGP